MGEHMSQRKVVLMRPQRLPSDVLHGQPLRPSVRIQAEYQNEWADLCTKMHATAWEALKGAVPLEDDNGYTPAMDAWDLTFWQRIQALRERLADRFRDVAAEMAARMIVTVDRNAERTLSRSLKEISSTFTVSQSDPPELMDKHRERIEANVRLITRIPQEYLDKVVEDVQAAIIGGQGLNDLQRVMEERYGTAKRWARQVALDQSNKAYRDINASRMREAGIRKFRWIHTSVPKKPRHYHKLSHAQGGLNGGVFSLDNPPVINQETGQRGLPGDDYFCHCIMQPVVDL